MGDLPISAIINKHERHPNHNYLVGAPYSDNVAWVDVVRQPDGGWRLDLDSVVDIDLEP